jgi:4-carboxymuconolactone decarboxylase
MEDRMQDRLGPIPFAAMSAAQQVAAQVVIDGPRGGLYGPFVPLIRSPELMSAAQQMGEYLRYRSAIGTRLTGGDSGDGAPLEPAGGVGDPRADRARLRHRGGGVAAIAARQRPAAGVLLADEALVYDFCVQLHQQRRVDDATYAAALAAFGEQGVVDLMGINGYTFLAMVMNAAQTATPASAAAPLPSDAARCSVEASYGQDRRCRRRCGRCCAPGLGLAAACGHADQAQAAQQHAVGGRLGNGGDGQGVAAAARYSLRAKVPSLNVALFSLPV